MNERAAENAVFERLVVRAAGGDAPAWRELWHLLEPRLAALVCKRTFVARMARREDECRDVVLAIMSHLHEDGFRRLHLYLTARRQDPALTFMRWLVVVAKRVAIDCLRAHPEYVDRRRSAAADEPLGEWIHTDVLPSYGTLPGRRLPMTNRVTARQILRYAGGVLSGDQLQALEMWASERSYEDIAGVLALGGPDDAEHLVRAAVERLRRHYRKDPAA